MTLRTHPKKTPTVPTTMGDIRAAAARGQAPVAATGKPQQQGKLLHGRPQAASRRGPTRPSLSASELFTQLARQHGGSQNPLVQQALAVLQDRKFAQLAAEHEKTKASIQFVGPQDFPERAPRAPLSVHERIARGELVPVEPRTPATRSANPKT